MGVRDYFLIDCHTQVSRSMIDTVDTVNTVDSVVIVDTVDIVDMVYTVDMTHNEESFHTRLSCSNVSMGKTG